jgi:hypothetical protein
VKRISYLALLALGIFCTSGSLHAQSHEIRAVVPFDFFVGNQLLPAGSYKFIRQSDDLILIGNRDQNIAVLTPSYSDSSSRVNESDLVFNKYGDRYFLNGIHCTSIAVNVEIPTSGLEKRTQHQLAQISSASRTFVALK